MWAALYEFRRGWVEPVEWAKRRFVGTAIGRPS